MNRNNTPFGYIPTQYLKRVCEDGGIEWDYEIEEYTILSDEKSADYRNKTQLKGVKVKNGTYAVVPKYIYMTSLMEAVNNYLYGCFKQSIPISDILKVIYDDIKELRKKKIDQNMINEFKRGCKRSSIELTTSSPFGGRKKPKLNQFDDVLDN